MTNRFLISVAAAALVAGSGLAFAQGAGGAGGAGGAAGGGSAPSAQQGTPSSERGSPSAAPMNRDAGESKGVKGAQSSEKMAPDGVSKGGMKDSAQSREGMSKDGMKDSAQSREGMSKDSKSTTTTGNAATSATAAPPPEKRTQIVSAIRSEKIQETTNVNFNISVGATVPGSVRFYPLPPRIVEIYPQWRGYEVILVSGRYIIVRPQTREIVYIIES
jgi:hypothetical protein